MSSWIKSILGFRGIHFIVTRLGTRGLRAASFDEKFKRGDWDFNLDPSAELVSIVNQHLCGGQILMLGCGSGSIAGALSAESFTGFTGIDISSEAIKRAGRFANDKIRFFVADCTRYRCDRAYDIILFSESLYYVSPLRRKALLKELQSHLTPKGSMIVTIANPSRYSGILRMIRTNFTILEDRFFRSGERHLIVFR